jgi:hypothetical protein
VGAGHYFGFALANPHYYRLMFQMAAPGQPVEIPEDMEHVGKRAFGFIRSCISEGIALGRFRTDFEEIVLSHNAWAHIHGAVALALADQLTMLNDVQQAAFFESMVESGVRGLFPECDD